VTDNTTKGQPPGDDGPEEGVAVRIGKEWPEQIKCSCGGKAQLSGPRFATDAEYRCASCGETVTRMVWGGAG